jgi:Domain of unknown function (DUF4190)
VAVPPSTDDEDVPTQPWWSHGVANASPVAVETAAAPVAVEPAASPVVVEPAASRVVVEPAAPPRLPDPQLPAPAEQRLAILIPPKPPYAPPAAYPSPSALPTNFGQRPLGQVRGGRYPTNGAGAIFLSPPRPPFDGAGIAAFIFGLFGLIVLAIPLGIVSLRRIKRRTRRGKGFAMFGLALSLVWIVLIALAVATWPIL